MFTSALEDPYILLKTLAMLQKVATDNISIAEGRMILMQKYCMYPSLQL